MPRQIGGALRSAFAFFTIRDTINFRCLTRHPIPPMSDTNPDPKTSIQVIERMMRLLDALAAHTDPVSLKELRIRTGLHPSTAHRILNDLVDGPLRRPPRTRQLPPRHAPARTRQSGQGAPDRARRRARRRCASCTSQTHQPVNLSVRQGDEIVYIERTYSERSGMQVVRAIGGRAPLHLTSVGKLFLAADEAAARARLRHAHRPGRPHPQQHHRPAEARARAVARCAASAVPRDDEELELGVRCMAAGIYDDTGPAGRRPVDLGAGRPACRNRGWASSAQTALQISRIARLSAASPA